jgi:hypothetical protein
MAARLVRPRGPVPAGLNVARLSRIPLVGRTPLENGTFLARLERSPFFVTGLRQLAERGSTHVLYGHFSEAEDARRAE